MIISGDANVQNLNKILKENLISSPLFTSHASLNMLTHLLPIKDEAKNRLCIDYDDLGCSAQLMQGQRMQTVAEDGKHKGEQGV